MIQKNLVHHSKSPAMQARVICHASTAWHSSALHYCSGRAQPFTVSLMSYTVLPALLVQM